MGWGEKVRRPFLGGGGRPRPLCLTASATMDSRKAAKAAQEKWGDPASWVVASPVPRPMSAVAAAAPRPGAGAPAATPAASVTRGVSAFMMLMKDTACPGGGRAGGGVSPAAARCGPVRGSDLPSPKKNRQGAKRKKEEEKSGESVPTAEAKVGVVAQEE